jgi:hypothetical protein
MDLHYALEAWRAQNNTDGPAMSKRQSCWCDACQFHFFSGAHSILYTTDTVFSELDECQQEIQLARHKLHGVCKWQGPRFTIDDLTRAQYIAYSSFWS